jgi:hypothetical protein
MTGFCKWLLDGEPGVKVGLDTSLYDGQGLSQDHGLTIDAAMDGSLSPKPDLVK